MSLIPCPECDESVSDRALACPHCGFPVAEEINKLLSDVTGTDRVRSARQRAAGAKLQRWATRYVEEEPEKRPGRWAARGESFIERHKRLVLVTLVTAIVILQLVLIYSAIYG